MKILMGGSEKIKGDSENRYTSKPTAGGARKKFNCYQGGGAC